MSSKKKKCILDDLVFDEETIKQMKEYDKILSEENNNETEICKDYNGFEVFIAFGFFDQIYEISLIDLKRNVLFLKEKPEYFELLKDYKLNKCGDIKKLYSELKELYDNKKISISDKKRCLITPTIGYDEAFSIINKVDKEKHKLIFSLLKDYRLLNSEYYQEEKLLLKTM